MPEHHRILVVDDNALDRQAVIHALQRAATAFSGIDANVLEAETVSQAREALQREEFACVFLDHDLPDGTALDLLLEVRSQGLVTPIVVLTGERNEEIMAEVMRAGAVDFLPKEKLNPELIAVSLRAALRFLQVQREKQVVFEELRARDRAIASASNGIVIADPHLPDCPLIYVNEAFLHMTGYTEAEVVGRNCRFLQGPDTDPGAVLELRDAVTHQSACQTLILNYRKDGTVFWNEITVSPVRDDQGRLTHFVGIQTDTTARQEVEAERRQAVERVRRRAERERFLADFADRVHRCTEPEKVIAEAVRSVGEFLGVSRCIFADIDIEADTCTIHPAEYRADASVASIVGVVSIASFGAFVVSEYSARRAVVVDDVRLDPLRAPAGSLSAYEAIGIRAHVTVPVVHYGRVVSCMSVHNATPRHWEPEEIELLRTVVERTWLTVEVIRQQEALVREAEERHEAHERMVRLLESITDAFFTLDHEWRFTYINSETERVLFRKGDELLGRYIWDAFPEGNGSTFDQQYRRAVAESIPVAFEEYYPPLEAWLEVRAYPSEDGLSVFFQDVSPRKRLEAERERLLTEQQQRAENEALLNRIGQSLRASLDPETVQAAATTLLGEALGADRCYFATYNLVQGVVTIGRDWHRPDLPSIQGVYPFVNTAEMFAELYQDSNASAIEDARTAALSTQTKANMEALGLRSRISVALVENDGIMATLTAAMSDRPRSWTEAEASLVEAIATQLRTAVETARVTQREHRIAEQLQTALQPPTPASVPGLTLADYYRPAWEDQGVGGDFSDIFSDDKGTTFLVVGDLSGKGLAAASQVAMVRNMLRFSLYNGRSVAGPVTALNRTLADHDLLTGFTTLFVGRYDAGTRVLSYVNCGQDAGLVLRAARSAVDTLPPTGPVLGAISSAAYTEETITLEAEDVLALYTDGLTEAGPSRTALLTGDGVAALLKQQAGVTDPRIIAARLMAGVDAYAGAGVRDDQCLLVAVVDHFANS